MKVAKATGGEGLSKSYTIVYTMNPNSLNPNQMRALCSRDELEIYVLRRFSTLNKRSAETWSNRNAKMLRSPVSVKGLNKETLIYMAAALQKCERTLMESSEESLSS
jgi:hypothetical protein